MKRKLNQLKMSLVLSTTILFIFSLAVPASAAPISPNFIVRVGSATNSTVGGWNMQSTKFTVSGNFDNSLGADLAVIYNYGNNNMGIIIIPEAKVSQATTIYLTGNYNWDLTKTKFVIAGDYNGDLVSNIAAVYDYGNNDMGIWIFYNGFLPTLVYKSGSGNWNLQNTKFVESSNFSNDYGDYEDLAMMYDYGDNKMGIWNFISNGATFVPKFAFYSNNWNINKTKFVVSDDYTGDFSGDLAAIYDYDNNDMGIWVFQGDPVQGTFTPSLFYKTGPGNWSLANTKFVSSGLPEIVMMYDYGNNNMGIWDFYLTAPGVFSPFLLYISGSGNWSVTNTKTFTESAFFNPYGPYGIASLYDYGNNTIGIWIFGYQSVIP
ncbi:MAG: hypothetical protein M1355_01260 [Patescibacteria group bacterium]|nr:hypothetical protein [Patescibacteria group bacterium]